MSPGTVIPSLPAEWIRAAIDAHDWPRATALLAEHQRALAESLAAVDLAAIPHEPWLGLLRDQRALLDELRDARNTVGAALARLGEDHRGARAWLRELA